MIFLTRNIIKNIFRSSGAISDSFVLFPVRNAYYSKDTPLAPPQNGCESRNDIYNVCDLRAASYNTIINNNFFNEHDSSSLGNIDSEIHYLGTNNMFNITHYYNDQSFRNKYRNNINVYMFHINIRSIPDHFLELTTLLNNLDMLLSAFNIYFMRGLPYISSRIYCILYCSVYTPINNHKSILTPIF